MAFWGTEVKPGKPFTHAPLSSRLHLSQATLGVGMSSARQKTIVQCNVGNKRPVYLCCLFPETAECCQLNLEFDESDEVVFSVIGPRPVHLTGFYLHNSFPNHHNVDSESYGEDIGETETEKSENSEDNEYGGSFINDDNDLQFYSSSSESLAQTASNDEISDLNKSKDGNRRQRRLRKKYQISESENDDSSKHKDVISAVPSVVFMDSEIEDTLPISSLCKGKPASNIGKADVEENARKVTNNLKGKEAEENANDAIGIQPESKLGNRDEANQKHVLVVDGKLMPKKKSKEQLKEESFPKANHGMIGKVVLEQNDQNQKMPSVDKSGIRDKANQKDMFGVDNKLKSKKKSKEQEKDECFHEANHGMTGKEVLEQNDQHQKMPNIEQVGLKDRTKLKKRKKECVEEKSLKDSIAIGDKGHKGSSNLDSITEDVHSKDKKTQNQINDKKRKKRKRCKNVDADALKMEPLVLSAQNDGEMECKGANDETVYSSNGFMIEELEMGKQDGKVASLGKKVRFHFTGKLSDSGQVFDSSVGKALLKFRLGGKEVPELWNVGLDGMRVGGKRRITAPASESYGNGGVMENIPPNSLLVFDVELVKVR